MRRLLPHANEIARPMPAWPMRARRWKRIPTSRRFATAWAPPYSLNRSDPPATRSPEDMRGNIGNLLKQAQAMQENLQKAQAQVALVTATGESGGGMVKITMSGLHEVSRV